MAHGQDPSVTDVTLSPDALVFLGQLGGAPGPLSLFGKALMDKTPSDQAMTQLEQAGLTRNGQMTPQAEGVMTCLVTPTHRMLVEQLTDQFGSRTEAFGTPYQGRLHYAALTARPDGDYRLRFPLTPESIFALFMPLSTATPSGCEEWSELLSIDSCMALLGAVETVRAKRLRASLPGGPPPSQVNWFGNGDVLDLIAATDLQTPPFGGIHGLAAQGLGLPLTRDEPTLQTALDQLGTDGILIPLGDGLFRLSPALYVMADRLTGQQHRLSFWMARLHDGQVEQQTLCVLVGANEPSFAFQILRDRQSDLQVLVSALSNESLGQMITTLYLDYSGDDTPAAPAPSPADQSRMFCEYCGARISAGAKFCENCGKSVSQ